MNLSAFCGCSPDKPRQSRATCPYPSPRHRPSGQRSGPLSVLHVFHLFRLMPGVTACCGRWRLGGLSLVGRLRGPRRRLGITRHLAPGECLPATQPVHEVVGVTPRCNRLILELAVSLECGFVRHRRRVGWFPDGIRGRPRLSVRDGNHRHRGDGESKTDPTRQEGGFRKGVYGRVAARGLRSRYGQITKSLS